MVWFNISIDNGYLTVIFLGPYFRNRLVKAYDKLVNTTGVMFSEHNELEQVSRHIVLKGLMYILMQMTTEPLPNSWKFPFVMIYPFSYYLYFGCRWYKAIFTYLTFFEENFCTHNVNLSSPWFSECFWKVASGS